MTNPDLNIILLEQLPPWYREVLDYQEICRTEQTALDTLAAEINAVGDNFFLQTMGPEAIANWENLLGIHPDLLTESEDFRRFRILNRLSSRPPFTMEFLRRKLDEIIGPGQWTVRMDYANYTLYVESSAKNQQYSGELTVTIGKIKPAHIVFINTPLVQDYIDLSETISGAFTQWNYHLGLWRLGGQPFQSTYGEEVYKVATTPSVQSALLSGTATDIRSRIKAARINGSILITGLTFGDSTAYPNQVTVTYPVTAAETAEITKAELLDSGSNPLTATDLYVAVGADGIQMKHTIFVQEGTGNG